MQLVNRTIYLCCPEYDDVFCLSKIINYDAENNTYDIHTIIDLSKDTDQMKEQKAVCEKIVQYGKDKMNS